MMVRVNVERLNVRTGAGMDYPAVNVVVKGEEFESLGEQNGFHLIGENEWIKDEFVEAFEKDIETEGEPKKPRTRKKAD